MAPQSPPVDPPLEGSGALADLRRDAGQLQIECAARAKRHWVTHLFWLAGGRLSSVLALALGAAVATEVFANAKHGTGTANWAGWLAAGAAGITALNTALEPLALAERHRVARIGFNRLARRYGHFRDWMEHTESRRDIDATWADLTSRLDTLEEQSPETGITAAKFVARGDKTKPASPTPTS